MNVPLSKAYHFLQNGCLKRAVIVTLKEEGISAVVHILSNCEVPKGGVITEEGILDNTIYTGTMCMESGTYYYYTYDCRQITAIHLLNENLDSEEIKTYSFLCKQKVFYEN
ncbi:choloylglycine hydrolase [Bacillus cereus]|nr:choloylglycine hydrolase [Bacillus cereus]